MLKIFSPAWIASAALCLALPACNHHHEEHHHVAHKITATSAQSKSVTLTRQYVCQIHSKRHINVRALETGYLEAIPIREGQQVNEGDLLFRVMPVIYQKKADAEKAEANLVRLEYNYTKSLFEKNVVSENEVNLAAAKLAKAEAKADLAVAELNFASVKAPFPGIVDRLHLQQGSLVQEGEELTTLSDNSVMWVYFNVPEARYLDYMNAPDDEKQHLEIDLILADGSKFPHKGKIGAIEADFNNETGNIPFRADFPNPEHLLRHGQTGKVLIHRVVNDALVIPQRATFEILDKQYVYVVDKDDVAHQREIVVENELEDIYLLKEGLKLDEKIVLEGVRQVRDGDKVEYESRTPAESVAQLKFHAE
jgi:membrane fusion protein (multidrug efflux system)